MFFQFSTTHHFFSFNCIIFDRPNGKLVRNGSAHTKRTPLAIRTLFPRVVSWFRFNPRTHEGCDYLDLFLLCLPVVSIRAPVWGAMSSVCFDTVYPSKFQSAHLCRVRWQHTVRFARSERSRLHSVHKIDVI